jgi:glycosyltransferase involved in cell wall biosynthesis
MRIGIVAFSGIFPIDIGGPGSVAYFLARWLGKQGDHVTLFVKVKTQRQSDSISQIGELTCLKNVNIIPIVLDYKLQTLINVPYLARKVYKTTKDFNHKYFDVVHYNSPPIDASFLFPIMSKLKRERQTLAVHGGIFEENKYAIGRLLIRIEKDLFDRIIVSNNFSRNLAIKANFKKDRIVVIPNGVDLEIINNSKPIRLFGEPKILYVGRLVKLKRVNVLLRAFAEVVKQFPDASLYIVGDGPLRNTLEQMAQKLKIRNNVMFQGFIPTMTVYRYYKSADILVLPSYVENFSITLLEGMASKIPIIASDAEGNLEIISNGKNGLIFPRDDYQILSEKMKLLISNRDIAQKLADNAYENVKKKYDWRVIGSLYHDTFRLLLA